MLPNRAPSTSLDAYLLTAKFGSPMFFFFPFSLTAICRTEGAGPILHVEKRRDVCKLDNSCNTTRINYLLGDLGRKTRGYKMS